MPLHTTVVLHGPKNPDLPLEAPHAVVSRWLDVDHKAAVKPYALGAPTAHGQLLGLPLRLLDDTLMAPLAEQAHQGAPVRLGRHWFTVAAQPQIQQHVSWSELARPTGDLAWEVDSRPPPPSDRGRAPLRGRLPRAC